MQSEALMACEDYFAIAFMVEYVFRTCFLKSKIFHRSEGCWFASDTLLISTSVFEFVSPLLWPSDETADEGDSEVGNVGFTTDI